MNQFSVRCELHHVKGLGEVRWPKPPKHNFCTYARCASKPFDRED